MKLDGLNVVFSIIGTGRCNCRCDYCHFYGRYPRETVRFDIEPDLFNRYVHLIKHVQGKASRVSCRFSGGEPLVMGNRLFMLSDKVHAETGIEPFVLTNGLLLDDEVIEEAGRHHVSSFVASVENPLHSENSLVSYERIVSLYRRHSSSKARVRFGMMVVRNDQFSRMKEIVDMFWSDCGAIPPMCEVNYGLFESPSKDQLNDLRRSVSDIVREYHGRCPLHLFPYVIPDLYPSNKRSQEIIIELPLVDKLGLMGMDDDAACSVLEERLDRSYFVYECDKECAWKEGCGRLKWLWNKPNRDGTSRIDDYCRLRRTLCEAYAEGLGIDIGASCSSERPSKPDFPTNDPAMPIQRQADGQHCPLDRDLPSPANLLLRCSCPFANSAIIGLTGAESRPSYS